MSASPSGHIESDYLTSDQFFERVKESLQTCGLDTEQVARVMRDKCWQWVVEHAGKKDSSFKKDSPFFNFAGKLNEVVRRFEKEGLTAEDYLSAAIEKPQLFCQSPATIEDNVRGLAKLFEVEGLNTKDYLNKAALKRPELFCYPPATVESNIRGLVKSFAREGLSAKDYLAAALEKPQLFYQLPATAERHIRGLVKLFEAEGLNTKDYLAAALETPQLFSQSPATIEGHIQQVFGLQKSRVITIDTWKHYRPQESVQRNILRYLLANPWLLTLDNTNFTLRQVHQRMTGAKPSLSYLSAMHPRKTLERELAASLGHTDIAQPVSKIVWGESDETTPERANNRVLRGLVVGGVIKSLKIEADPRPAKVPSKRPRELAA